MLQFSFQQVLCQPAARLNCREVTHTLSSAEPLKLALAVEAKAWKTAYGHSLNARYRASMEAMVTFVNDYSKKLTRPIKVQDLKTMNLPTCTISLLFCSPMTLAGLGGCTLYDAGLG